MQHVQHAHRVGFGGVGADVHGHLGVLHVVVRIGHGAVAPCIRNAGHRGGMADTRLVVAVVAAPVAHELAHQVRLLVVVFGRAHPVDGVGSVGLAQLQQLGADFLQRRVPADALVFAVHQLHRVTQAVFAMAVLTQRSPLGAVGAEVDRGVEHRLLAHPYTVLDHRIDSTAHRAVAAHGAFHFKFGVTQANAGTTRRLGLLHQ